MSKLENKCRIAKISANIYLYTSATVAAGSRLRILNEVDKNVRQAPLRRNLPLPRPGVDRPLRGNCHPLSCTPDNQVRCVFGSAPYQKPPSTVRNMRAVLKKASWGTRRIFRGVRCKKQASTVRKGYSVPETHSYGTGRVFRGAKQPTPQTVDSLLLHRTHFQRRETADSDTRPLNYPVRPYPSAPPHLKYGLNY